MDPRLELPPEPGSVALARRWITRHASEVGGGGVDPALLDTLELLVSEVVTNAVVHADTTCTMTLMRCDDRLRIEVSDGSSALPVHRSPPELAEGGRGVGLVAMLSDDCGSHRSPDGGKTCWFEVCIPPITLARSSVTPAKMGRMTQ